MFSAIFQLPTPKTVLGQSWSRITQRVKIESKLQHRSVGISSLLRANARDTATSNLCVLSHPMGISSPLKHLPESLKQESGRGLTLSSLDLS